jgi:hypothetical protein
LFKSFEIIEDKIEENEGFFEETKTEGDDDEIEMENEVESVKEFNFTIFLDLVIQ